MKPTEFLKENEFIGDDAHQMHKSHQHHMLREECYHSAANAIKLHQLLGELPEGHELDAWAAEKISLANDYLKTVTEWLEYDVMGKTNEAMMAGGMEAFSMESAERAYEELLGEDSHMYKGPHGHADVERKGGVTKVSRRDWVDPSSDPDKTNTKGSKHFSNTKLKTGGSVQGSTGHSSINRIPGGGSRKMPKFDHDANDTPNFGESAGGMGAGSVATTPGKVTKGAGSLFGGSYQNPANPFRKKASKKK